MKTRLSPPRVFRGRGGAPSLFLLILTAVAVGGQAPPLDGELRAYLAEMQGRIHDSGREVGERQRLALEAARALDRAAAEMGPLSERWAAWSEAAQLLETVPEPLLAGSRGDEIRYQAAVLRWAIARGHARRLALNPTEDRDRAAALAGLEDVARRLKAIADRVAGMDQGHDEGLRLQRARVEVELAELWAEGGPERREHETHALDLVSAAFTEAGPRTEGLALQVDLLNRLGRYDDATCLLNERGQELSPGARSRARAASLARQGRFAAALALVEGPDFDPAVREMARFDVEAMRWRSLSAGPEQDRVAAHLGELAEHMTEPGRRQARIALARLLGTPDPASSPLLLESVAEGQALLGQPAGAAELLASAARAEDSREQVDRARALGYRAASYFIAAGQAGKAIPLLQSLVDGPQSTTQRPQADLMLALVLDRTGETTRAGMVLDGIVAAFPGSTQADEARWVLGKRCLEAGQDEAASGYWGGISARSTRWLEAFELEFTSRLAALEPYADEDPGPLPTVIAGLRTYLGKCAEAARRSEQKAAVELARLRLEISPAVRPPDSSTTVLARLRAMPLTGPQRRRSEWAQVALEARRGRYAEAAGHARAWRDRALAEERLECARWFDRAAIRAGSDLERRRFGELAYLMLEGVDGGNSGQSGTMSTEAGILKARARAFRGGPTTARRELAELGLEPSALARGDLALAAETLRALGELAEARSFYQELGKRSAEGTRDWFAARLGIARCHEAGDHRRAARQVIEATQLLHPDLGGDRLRAQFERLRNKLGPPDQF